MKKLISTFKALDLNKDGVVSKEELLHGFKISNCKIEESKLEAILTQIDSNGSSQIDFTEFVLAATNRCRELSNLNVEQCFAFFDHDRDGKISLSEFKMVFLKENKFSDEEWASFMKQADQNGNGEIEIDEFKEILAQIYGY